MRGETEMSRYEPYATTVVGAHNVPGCYEPLDRLVSLGQMQPFAQVPIFEEDGFILFESGAIVLHIGERCEVLLPGDPAARARAAQWVIAALNSIEPYVGNVAEIDLFHAD